MLGSLLRVLNGFSYKEKSTLISLLAIAGIYGPYLYHALSAPPDRSPSDALASLIGLVVALVIVHVIFHIVISLDDTPERSDERDRAIDRKASVLGYNVLSAGVLVVMGRVLTLGAWAEAGAGAAAPGAVEIVDLLLASLVVSEIVYYAARLTLSRLEVAG